MAKAKYKIGWLIAVPVEGQESPGYGVIQAVVTRKDGYSYMVGGVEFAETDILGAYKQIAGTTRRTTTTKTKTKKGKGTRFTTDTQQEMNA